MDFPLALAHATADDALRALGEASPFYPAVQQAATAAAACGDLPLSLVLFVDIFDVLDSPTRDATLLALELAFRAQPRRR